VQTKTSFENSKIFNNLKLRIRPNESWSTRLRNRPGATLELCAKKWVILLFSNLSKMKGKEQGIPNSFPFKRSVLARGILWCNIHAS
jgi:hypothetical protein